jgi:hypothetical protein
VYVAPVFCTGGVYCGGHVDPSTGNVALGVEAFDVGEGTVFSVSLTNPDGTVLAAHAGVVAYDSVERNGPGCGTCTEGRF